MSVTLSDLQNRREMAEVGPAPVPAAVDTGTAFSSAYAFEAAQRMARLLASSSLCPQSFRGNIADTVIALEMAQRLGASPLAVMQNLNIIHGRPSWSAVFIIASINGSGRFTPLRYEIDAGETRCRAVARDRASGETLVGPEVTLETAHAEGWSGRSGSKWKTIPGLMLRYRAAAWWGRLYAPELSMGIRTVEEEAEMGPAPKSIAPTAPDAGLEESPPWNDQPPVQNKPAPDWPASLVDRATGETVWRDARGDVYNPSLHGWNFREKRPSVTALGLFRARRTVQAASGEPALPPNTDLHVPDEQYAEVTGSSELEGEGLA